MKILTKALKHENLLIDDPPVLMDIGASSTLPADWGTIAPYSICIAFEPDARDFKYIEKQSSNYKKMYVIPKIVTDEESSSTKKFYLTSSPYCSSMLEPDADSLKNYLFSDLFVVDKTIEYQATTLQKVLKELDIKKIDWYKTDTQGTDLRLFKSIPQELIKKIIVAEFEPGILNAYKNEDKLYSVIDYLSNLSCYWMDHIEIKHVPKISKKISDEFFNAFEKKYLKYLVKGSPGWAEVSFFNDFKNKSFSKRDYLLGYIFAITKKQYGFSLELAINGYNIFKDDIFNELKENSLKLMKVGFKNLLIFSLKYMREKFCNFL